MKAKIIILLLGLLLCFFVYPSAFIYPKDTLPDNNDTRLIAYIIGQVQQNIIYHKPLYLGTYFAPEPNTLTYSDLFLTTSLLTLPLQLFTTHPILIFNIAFILSFTLTFYSSFQFFNYLNKSVYLSLICAIIFNLSGYHLHYYAHLQVFSFWLFFSALLNLLKFLKTNNKNFLHLFLIFTTLQLAETIFSTYLLFFTSLFIALDILKKRRSTSQNRTEHAHAPSVAREYGFWRGSSFVIYPVMWPFLLLPYAKTHQLYEEASRSIRDAAHFSLGLEEIFTMYQSWTVIVVVIASFLLKAWQSIKTNIKFSGSPRRILLAKTKWCSPKHIRFDSWQNIFLFSLIMSLGPVLKIFNHTIKIFGLPIPLPYTIFYYLFPGFTGFRTPSRFILLVLFAICTYIGIRTTPYFKKLKIKTQAIIAIFIFCLLCIEANLPLTGYPVNITPPTIYKELKYLPNEAIVLELPIKLWNMPDHEIESIRSLYSLEHKKRRLGGFSGFATKNWINLVEEINTNGLSPEIIQKLKNRGVTHIIQNNTLQKI